MKTDTDAAQGGWFRRALPVIEWLPSCTAASIRTDILAGLALAALLVPQGVAYAGIAGVPPQAGLLTAAAGLFIYALFGTSRHLAVAATSGSAAMLAALVGPLAQGDAARYSELASATAIAAAVLLVMGGVFKLGFVSEFISKPVLKGFVFGLALTIIVGQASSLVGVEKGKGDFFEKLWHLIGRIPDANPWTAAVGGVALLLTFGVGAFLPRVPSALVVFVLGIWAVRQFGLGENGVEIVGQIQGGMPAFAPPHAGRLEWLELISGAIGIVLIMYAEALAGC